MKKKETIKGYKGFDKNLKCRGYQFEIGKTFKEKEKPMCCNNGFHFCEYPLDVFGYYAPSDSRFCEVEALGDIDKEEENTKIATNKIKIGAEINFESLTKAAINFIYERVNKEETEESTKNKDNSIASNTGDSSVASNTGDRSVASNTGYSSVASNTGYSSVASNTGYSSVASNTGDSSVASNTGDRSVASNTGDRSVASNTGYSSVASNTGDRSVASNTGDRSVASNTGEKGIASSIGIEGKAKGSIGTWLVLAEWKLNNDYCWEVKEVKTAMVDGENIKADTLYQLNNGEFVEVEDE